jgi:para-nitrobenzyl esterase
MFGRLDQEPGDWTHEDRALSETMTNYWVNFVRTGNPNSVDLPNWPAYGRDNAAVLRLDDPTTVGEFPDPQALDVFDALYAALRQTPLE